MFACVLGKNIFSFNLKHCFAWKNVIKETLFSNYYEDFWKRKHSYIKNKILCVSRRGGGEASGVGMSNHDPTKAIYQQKKKKVQVLSHIISSLRFLCSGMHFPCCSLSLHTSWPLAFKSFLKEYATVPEKVKESSATSSSAH